MSCNFVYTTSLFFMYVFYIIDDSDSYTEIDVFVLLTSV